MVSAMQPVANECCFRASCAASPSSTPLPTLFQPSAVRPYVPTLSEDDFAGALSLIKEVSHECDDRFFTRMASTDRR